MKLPRLGIAVLSLWTSAALATIPPCDWLLSARPEVIRRFDISASQFTDPSNGPRYARVAVALGNLNDQMTPTALDELSGQLMDAPSPEPAMQSQIDQSDFFLAHPGLNTEDARRNFVVIRSHVKTCSDYEAGLLAVLINEHPRHSHGNPDVLFTKDGPSLQQWMLEFARAPGNRELLLKLLQSILKNKQLFETVLRAQMVNEGIITFAMGPLASSEILSKAIDDLRLGRASDPTGSILMAVQQAILLSIVKSEKIEVQKARTIPFDWWRTAIFKKASQLGVDWADLALGPILEQFMRRSFLNDDSPPTSDQLDRKITRAGRRLLLSLAISLPVKPLEGSKPPPHARVDRDFYEPMPQSKKRRHGRDPSHAVPSAPKTKFSPVVKPFKLVGQQPKRGEVLETNNDGRSPVTHRVRFGPRVLRWMKANTEMGEDLLARLDDDGLVKPQTGKKFGNSNYGGTTYLVKPDKRFYAVLIQVEGVWQVIDVVHNDHLERTLRNLTPLRQND